MSTTRFEQAQTLDDAFGACDHDQPLDSTDTRYVDLSAGRGENTVRIVKRCFTQKSTDQFVRIAFLSHRGAGKTTELKRICADLSSHFVSLYVVTNETLDPRFVTIEDLLLSFVIELERLFEERKTPLDEELVTKVFTWFDEVTRESTWSRSKSGEAKAEAGVGVALKTIFKFGVELKGLLKTESTYRESVREAFRRYPSALIAHVNTVLNAANAILEKEGKTLLVVLDNMDRYDPTVAAQLLVRSGARLRELQCNMIVTPPIALHYQPDGESIETYFQPQVMSTLRLRKKEQSYTQFDEDGLGRSLLIKALEKRMNVAKLIPDTAALDRLILASGGAIRDLLRLVRESILRADADVLTKKDVDRAVAVVRSEMRDRININGWAQTLASIAITKQVNAAADCMTVLFHRLALKYNGEVWYDIHPLVAELPEVEKCIADLRFKGV
jgi:hypothetical protein